MDQPRSYCHVDKTWQHDAILEWFQSRWHRPHDVLWMGVHINIYKPPLGVCAIYSQSTILPSSWNVNHPLAGEHPAIQHVLWRAISSRTDLNLGLSVIGWNHQTDPFVPSPIWVNPHRWMCVSPVPESNVTSSHQTQPNRTGTVGRRRAGICPGQARLHWRRTWESSGSCRPSSLIPFGASGRPRYVRKPVEVMIGNLSFGSPKSSPRCNPAETVKGAPPPTRYQVPNRGDRWGFVGVCCCCCCWCCLPHPFHNVRDFAPSDRETRQYVARMLKPQESRRSGQVRAVGSRVVGLADADRSHLTHSNHSTRFYLLLTFTILLLIHDHSTIYNPTQSSFCRSFLVGFGQDADRTGFFHHGAWCPTHQVTHWDL